jgi:general L-amino acid transport system permease protein
MTVLADPPKPSFRLSQLLYDTRYRSLTIQVFALLLIVLLIAFLVVNVITNLHQIGKDIDFGFLGVRSGYDINQMLIPYDSSMSHGRAALVGICNTLLVAAMGCVTATVIGVLAGVLRLSKNKIVAFLMAVYVEGFRNVPLVLWILLVYAILTEGTPQPRDFVEGGTASMWFFQTVAVTNRGVFVPMPVFGPGAMALFAVFLASLIGIFGFRAYARRVQESTGRIMPVFWVSLALLIVPSLIGYFVLGRPVTFNSPVLGGFNFDGGLQVRNSLIALWLALSLYTGAFIAEGVRAGILAISKGQSEAAFALGLRPGRTMSLVILPQALRVIIPPLISQYLNLTKNSSLAIAVSYMDVRATLGGITINQTGRELEGILLLGGFYLAVSIIISVVMNAYNRSKILKER